MSVSTRAAAEWIAVRARDTSDCGARCRGCGSRRGRRPGHPGNLRRLGVGGQAGLGEAPAGRRPGNRSRVRRATESTVPPRPPSPPRRP